MGTLFGTYGVYEECDKILVENHEGNKSPEIPRRI